MLISSLPVDWKMLQSEVARVLSECGMATQVEYTLRLVRGQADIDVYATDKDSQPPTVYVCECKRWSSSVPQTVVHALRQVVTDGGANWGLLISQAGFQSGAYKAARKSNVKLLTWDQFCEMFASRWVDRYLRPALRAVNEPLVDYTEPMSPRVIRHPMRFDDVKRETFAALVDKYQPLAFYCLSLYQNGRPRRPLTLPLQVSEPRLATDLPADVMEEQMLRPFLKRLRAHIDSALQQFDTFFGGRI